MELRTQPGSLSYVKAGGPLTPRQHQLLVLLAEGYTNKEAAHELGITVMTVKNIHTSIYIKLEAKNAPHAVMIAVRKGIL